MDEHGRTQTGAKPWPEDDPNSMMNRHERRRARAQRAHDEGKKRARRKR